MPSTATEAYVCQRCREVLAGGNAVDLRPSDAQTAARTAAGERLKAFRVVLPSPEPEIPSAAEFPQSAEPQRHACRRHRPVWRLTCADCNPQAERDPGALPANWRSVRAGVMRRDGRRCEHCGSRGRLSVHHITPRPLGTHDPKNLKNLFTLVTNSSAPSGPHSPNIALPTTSQGA